MKAGPVVRLVLGDCWGSTYKAYQVDLVFQAIVATKVLSKMHQIDACQALHMGSCPQKGPPHLLQRAMILEECTEGTYICQAKVHASGCTVIDIEESPLLCRAVAYASELGVPIYVTENGIPSKKDDDSREEWINGYLTEVR